MSYKVTITNNETGAVLTNEENAVAIVGAIGNGQGTLSIGFIDCDAISLGDAISETEAVISKIKNEVPAVDLLLQLKAMEDKTKANQRGGRMKKQEQIEEVRKETAKEILSDLLDLHNMVQDINQKTDFYYSIEQLIAEIEIKYGVEVEE